MPIANWQCGVNWGDPRKQGQTDNINPTLRLGPLFIPIQSIRDMKKIISLVCILGISLLITSCGGGSDSDSGIETYTFDLTNRVAKAYPEKCTNGIVSFEMKFLKDGMQFVRGTDSVDISSDGTCAAKQTAADEIGQLAPYAMAKSDGFLIPCGGPVCTLAQLNASYSGTDGDGRAWTQVVSHVKNSNEIVSTKSWMEGQTAKVAKTKLKFVDDGYFIDLTSKTGSVYALKCTPPIVSFKLRFTAEGLGFTEGTDSVNLANDGSCTAKPTPQDEIGVIAPYSMAKSDGFIIPCGNAICTGYELNLTYIGTDEGGRAWTQVVSHIKGSKEISSTKSWMENGVRKEAPSKLVLN